MLNYWIKPTKQRIKSRKIQKLLSQYYLIGNEEGVIQKLTNSKSSPTTLEYLSSTSLSSVAQRVSYNQDFISDRRERGELNTKRLTMENGELFLNGEKIENLKSYKISSSAKEKGLAELEIVIDVITSSVLPESKQ